MKRLAGLAIFLICAIISGCRVTDTVVSQQFMLMSVQKHDVSMTNVIYADLNNDNIDEAISSDANQGRFFAIYVGDTSGKIYSQINLHYEIQNLKVLTNPKDNKAWLFYSFNDGVNARLMASQYTWGRESKREDKIFSPIPRVFREGENRNSVWNGQLYPEFIKDTDGDGREELVCRGLCGFQANPRGLMVYDFDTGALEWYYRTPSNVNALLFDDFDDNGTEEFIFANVALKNTEEQINDIDDMNGYIAVLDNRGKLITREQHFPGYGEAMLEVKNNTSNGVKDIYRSIVTWGNLEYNNSVSILNFNGKKLTLKKSYDMAKSLERAQVQGFMKPMDRDGNEQIFLLDKERGLIVLDSTLNPVPNQYTGFVKYIWDVRDIDHNGNKEYLLETEDGYFEILDHKLRLKARLKSPEPTEANMRLLTLSPGFGKDALIAITSPTTTYYYQVVGYPFYKLIDDFLKAYAWHICIVLISFLVFIVWLYRSRSMAYSTATNNLPMGFIVVSGTNKVTYYSKYVRNLLLNNLDTAEAPIFKSLKTYMPSVHMAVTDLHQSRQYMTNLKLHIQLGKLNEEFECSITRRNLFPRKYVIIIAPISYSSDGIKEKLEWAETARRLSHNVRRHITNVVLALEPLSESCATNEKAIRYLDMIRNETELIRVFTHSFQRFTELKDYDLKRQDIIPIVEHCLAHANVPGNIRLISGWENTPLEALVEPVRFEEALSNIVNNAIDAMQGGGVLRVTVKSFPAHELGSTNLSVLIEVEDNGYGIPAIYMDDIYKPFFTTKQSGTGIGIPESVKIIESMQGVLQVQSEESVGTTVSIWLKGDE